MSELSEHAGRLVTSVPHGRLVTSSGGEFKTYVLRESSTGPWPVMAEFYGESSEEMAVAFVHFINKARGTNE